MKKVIIAAVLLSFGSSAYSQSEISGNGKLKFGFDLGTNYSLLRSPDKIPLTVGEIRNDFGLRLGVFLEYDLVKKVSFSPRMGLSFNSTEVFLVSSADNSQNYSPFSTMLDVSGSFIFKEIEKKVGLYVLLGATFQKGLAGNSNYSSVFPVSNNFSVDVGIGLNRAFSEFILCPELKYSVGLMDVNTNPILQSLYFHSVSLVFGFKS